MHGMRSKINVILFCAAFIMVILACGICVISATKGSVYIQTKGVSSDNIQSFLDSVIAGDGSDCIRHTDSYKEIDLDISEETGTVAAICKALQRSYFYDQIPEDADAGHSIETETSVNFQYLDLNKLADDIASNFDEYVYATAMEYDENVTAEDGKYIREVYEKAYAKS